MIHTKTIYTKRATTYDEQMEILKKRVAIIIIYTNK